MTTRLDAINTMLSCIDHMPINTLEGTKSFFIVSAEQMLDSEIERVQLKEWEWNTEENYPLIPDEEGIITVPQNAMRVKIPSLYLNQYTIRDSKIYDKINHTFTINHPLRVTIVFALEFEELPEAVQRFITMSAAYKFTKRQLGAQADCIYTQEDLSEAYRQLTEYELDLGNYSFIKEYFTREIRSDL